VYRSLREPELRQIIHLQLADVQKLLLTVSKSPYVLDFRQDVHDWFLKHGTNLSYGARPLSDLIENTLIADLSSLQNTNQVTGGDVVLVDVKDDHLVYSLHRS
jgi:ATP-dependent Clp protease ATP-binding subunit ClpA